MTHAYRLCKEKWKADSGQGASLHGGRWNPVGVEVIYTSSSAALSILERIVHFTAGDLPDDDVVTEIHIPDAVKIDYVSADQLPANWDALFDSPEAQAFGGQWVAERRSCVLSVPSSILESAPSSVVRTERNLVINPAHLDFGLIEFFPSKPFAFDLRLK